MAVQLIQRALIDVGGAYEAVSFPLLQNQRGGSLRGSLLSDAEEQGPKLGRGQSFRQRRIGRFLNSRVRPIAFHARETY